MEQIEIRAVIKYQYLKGLKPQDIIDDFKKTLGTSAPSNATVYNWYNEFKRGRTSINDEHRSGRPLEVTTPENVQKIHRMVMNDRKLKLSEIAEVMYMSKQRVGNILHEFLGMKKLNARWVPRLLTPDQKERRVIDSEHCLAVYNRDPNEFLRRFITMDETWIHHYTPESNKQSAEWRFPHEPRAKRPKTQESAGKVLASVFWDARGIILTDYLEKGRTVTADYYVSLLDQLEEKIKEKRPHMQKKKTSIFKTMHQLTKH